MTEVWAVLVAAGRGERLGAGQPKAFVAFNGRPLLAESLSRLDTSEFVRNVVVVAPPGWEEPAILCAEEENASNVIACVPGGDTRVDSVRAGVEEVPAEADIILIHDAARPLVNDEVIGRVIEALHGDVDGAVPGLPVSDTIKQAPAGLIERTVSRDGLFIVQTPQCFRAEIFRRALADVDQVATDCAGMVEAIGGRVRLTQGDPRLAKITTEADLAFVEGLARQ